jgi:hypothetical protein
MPIKPPAHHFIDANLIMYSLGGSHPLGNPCKRILDKIKTGEILAVTNTEVLQEILYRFFSIGRPALAEIAYASMVQFCTAILSITLQDMDKTLELLKSRQGITSRDAVHAATMINHGIKKIISVDHHFDLIPGIKRIDPASFGA